MKKKILVIMLACVMLVIASIHVFAIVDACPHNNGIAMGLYRHDEMGSGCSAYERYYCDLCDKTLYTVDTTYTLCPTWHTRYPNWQN